MVIACKLTRYLFSGRRIDTIWRVTGNADTSDDGLVRKARYARPATDTQGAHVEICVMSKCSSLNGLVLNASDASNRYERKAHVATCYSQARKRANRSMQDGNTVNRYETLLRLVYRIRVSYAWGASDHDNTAAVYLDLEVYRSGSSRG